MTITNLVIHPPTSRFFGFASDADGVEYFIPRRVIVEYGLTPQDLGATLVGYTIPNPTPMDGKNNCDHVTRFEME